MSKELNPTLCKAARALLQWNQTMLSQKAGIAVKSVSRFEDGKGSLSPTIRDKIYEAFVNAGIQFIATNTDDAEIDGIGLRFKPKYPEKGIKVL